MFDMHRKENIIMAFITIAAMVIWSNVCYGEYKEEEANKKYSHEKKAYVQETIKKDPLMIPLFNKYFECKEEKVVAVEGCIDFAAKTAEEKNKIQAAEAHINRLGAPLKKNLL
jgi:hypothetical protein